MDWWRNTATLDMDFVHNRYMVSLTTPVVYTSLSQFITAVSGTFIRAGVNTTATGDPFYLAANQSFVSRGSTGTFFDSSGVMQTAATNTARADYNPATLAYQGILIEPARTNLLLQSQLNATYWANGPNVAVSYSNALSPMGDMTAATVAVSGSGILHRWLNSNANGNKATISVGTTYTYSVYVKPNTSVVSMSLTGGKSDSTEGATANYHLVGNGSVMGYYANGAGTYVGSGIQSVGSGWYRIWVASQTSSTTAGHVGLSIPNSSDAVPGTSWDVWGAQIEQGSFPTSYIPTSGTAASRAADVFTAPDSGTYFDASGTLRLAPAHTPRLDHDPSTTEPKGILIEEQRTNVAPSDITASPWLSYSPGGTTNLISNSDVAPDGTTTAHRITCGGVGSCTRYMAPTVTSGTTYTFSFFTKAPSGGTICNRGRSGSATGGGVTYFSTNVGNGWIRHGFYETVTSSGTWLPSIINYSLNTPCTIWGPQIETGAFPTSYIPTSASSVTRAAEVFSVPTGAWYNPVEGTALVVADHSSTISQTAAALVLYDVNNVNCHRVALSEDSLGRHSYRMMVSDDCSVWDGRDADVIGSGLFSMGAAIKDGDSAIGAHGTVFEATSVPMPPNLNTMSIGSSGGYASFWNRPIRRVTYFPTRQPDYSLPDYTR